MLVLCGLALAILIPLGAIANARRNPTLPQHRRRQVGVGTFAVLLVIGGATLLLGLRQSAGLWVLVAGGIGFMVFAYTRAGEAIRRTKRQP